MSDRSASAPPDPEPARRRRSLLRSLLRLLLWTAAVVAVLLVVGYFAGTSDWTQERVRRFVEAQLSDYLQRDVTIARVEYGLRPGRFVAYDLVVPSPDPDDPPFATVPRVTIQLAISGFLAPNVDIRRVDVERPQVYVILHQDGTTNLPEIRPSTGGGPSRVEVDVGRIVIAEGVLHFDDRELPLTIDASAVKAILQGAGETPEGARRFTVVVAAQELSSTLPDAHPWGGSLAAKGTFEPGRIQVTGGRLRGPDLQARFTGHYTWETETRDVEVQIEADGRAELANRLGYLEEPVAGPFSFRGLVRADADSIRYQGTVRSAELAFLDRRFRGLVADVTGGEDSLRVDVERVAHAGGDLSGTVTIDLAGRVVKDGETFTPVAVDARFRDVEIGEVLADLELDTDVLDGLSGRGDGSLVYRFTTDDPFAGSGEARVDLDGAYRGVRGELPLAGGGKFTIHRGVLSSDHVQLAGGGQRLTASGRYDLTASRGRFELRLRTSDLGRLAAALPLPAETAGGETPPPWLPTAGEGTAEGTLELAAGDFSLRGRVDLAPVVTPALSLDRLTAPVVYEGGVISSQDLVAEGPGQRLLASGSYDLDSGRAEVDYRLTTGDLGELAALVPIEGERPVWLPTAGSGTAEGSLTVAADGTLTGRTELDLAGVAVAGVTLDRLAGSASFVPGQLRDLRVEAASGDGALMATGQVPLPPPGGGEPSGPIDLEVQAVDWPAETLAALIPSAPEVEGRISAHADLGGTFAELHGTAEVSSGPLTIAGIELSSLAGDARMEGDRLYVERLRATAPAGEVVAAGAWDRGSGQIRARLTAAGLELGEAPFRELIPGDLSGRADLRATLAGSLDQPRVEVRLTTTGLELEDRPLGEGGESRLAASWADEQLTAHGSLLGLVSFDGGGRLTFEEADLSVALASDDLSGLVQLVSSAPLPDFTGSLRGTVTVAGRFDAGEPPAIQLTLPELQATYQERTIHNLEPVSVRLGPDRLEIESLYLGEPDGDSELFVVGSVGLGGETAPLDLRLQADIATAWLELFVPGVELAGDFRALATVGGTLSEPRLNGQGEIVDGRVIVASFPHALDHLTATVLLYPQRIVLDSLRADVAGGDLRAAGSVELGDLSAGEVSYRFQAEATNVSLRYPEGFLIRGDASLTLASTADGRLLSGVVDLERAFYLEDVPVGVLDILGNALGPSRLEAGDVDPELAATQLNIAVEGTDALRVRNNVANLQGDLELAVRGSLANPILFGQVEVDPGGKIVYADNEYRVERGLVTFSNPYRIDPVIDLSATTEVRNYDVTLNLSGTLERLNTSFSSDPPLPDLSIISLLTTGQPLAEGGELFAAGGGAGGGPSAQTFLYGQAASAISERVNTLFGFDRFRVSPVSKASSSVSSLAFTVGKQISSDVFVTYSRDPSTPEVDVFQVEWQVKENVLLLLTQNGDGSYAVDVQVERRF